MKRSGSKLLCILLLLSLLLSLTACGKPETQLEKTAGYLQAQIAEPGTGSVGGDWLIFGLARSGVKVPQKYFDAYYENVEAAVREKNGVLSDRKYTEYSRTVLALTAIGKNPADVAGFDLLKPLADFEQVTRQGINGTIFALLALDSGNYEIPENPDAAVQATRQMYIDRILDCQLPDGGWSLFGGTAAASSGDGVSDPDITGMALQALAKYQDQAAVAKATEEALACMSKQQDASAGYASWGTTNSESCVQMIVALCELGIPLDDSRFVKNGKTMLDNLMTFYLPGNGFLHTADGSGSNQMASEQAFYGLIAAQRARAGRNSLYRMGDSLTVTGELAGAKPGEGLEGKDPAVTYMPIVDREATFPDITGVNAHKNQPAIESLASRGVISGKSDGNFDPDGDMTRAEFAAIVVKALGLTPAAADRFTDVPADGGYAG